MHPLIRIMPLLLIAATATAAQAKVPASPATPLASCVDLTADHQAFGYGSQLLFVRDADSHYKVSFSGDCEAIVLSPQVEITTAGHLNRLCPQASRVATRGHACAVRSVEEIDANQYARYRRMSR